MSGPRCALIRARLRTANNVKLERVVLNALAKALRLAAWLISIMNGKSLQETYAPNNACWGCGPANAEGLRIRSFPKNGEVVAEWKPEKKYEAFPGVLNGGVIGTLLDCHCNWTAAYHLMKRAKQVRPPCTVTAEYSIKLLRPTPSSASVFLSAKVADLADDRATVEGTLSAGGKVCASCRGIFVAVKEGHPAYHRW
jgi:acyl-coenzyme A thioesterase PaaI-like protein